MVRAIMTNGVNTIIVESLDRLAREYRIQEQLLIYLASKGIDLISANTAENVTEAIQDDPMKKAMIQMQGIFAELDKSLLVKKLRIAREKVKAETGKCGGAKRYGEDSPEEQAIIHKIKLKRRPNKLGKRLSLQAVADWLNEQGIRTKRGSKWSAMQVQRVLSY